MNFSLKNYLKLYKLQVILGPFFKFLEAVADIISPFLVALILDVGIPNNDKQYILTMSLIVIAMNILGFVFAIICQKCSALACQGIGKNIRKDMYTKITTLSSREMDKYTTMSFTNRCVSDVAQVQTAVGMTIRQVSRAPFLLIGSAVLAMIIDVKLSSIFLLIMPFILLVFFVIMKRTTPLFSETKIDLDNLSNVTRENLSGNRVVRAFNKQDYEKQRFDKSNKKYINVNLKVGAYSAMLQPLLSLIVNMGIVAVVYFGGFQVNIGGLTQGQIISLINYLTQIAASLVVVARLIITYTRTGASIKRIKEVFSLENSVKEIKQPLKIENKQMPTIEFKNVSFSYNGVKDALKNFNMTIKQGETIGIIGGTGSGKSSLVNLLPRFYDVSEGEILIDGKNIKDYELNQLREIVSIVPQNPTLFTGTIESNLKFRKSNAAEAELKKALILSQSYEFVMEKPDGIKSKVERGGRNFSGGQRQRLTIARAIVGEPKILILDDSSSALDFQTDFNLRKALNHTLKNTTKIYVSQRTNSIKQADKIVVLDAGEVVGVGVHSELLKNCAVYKEIYDSQNS